MWQFAAIFGRVANDSPIVDRLLLPEWLRCLHDQQNGARPIALCSDPLSLKEGNGRRPLNLQRLLHCGGQRVRRRDER